MSEPEASQPVVVDVLTGFLGAGKTTLVRRLLAEGALADTAILVNEFAGLPLDQRVIGLAGGDVAILGDRCLCCVVDGNLRAALIGLLERRSSGEVSPFTRILIETSGIADPTPLLATLVSDPALKRRIRLGRVVTLVDLCNAAETLDELDEAAAQIVPADIVCLTKADLAPASADIAIRERISALNPLARVIATVPDGGLVNPFDRRLFPDDDFRARSALPFSATAAGARHEAIAATVLRRTRPVDWARFASWLSLLVHRHGSRILRIKGTIVLAGEETKGPVVIQSVRHIVHLPEHLPAGERSDGAELVVIARGIDPALLRRSFETFQGEVETSAGTGVAMAAG